MYKLTNLETPLSPDKNVNFTKFLSIISGNILNHYDKALFGFLTPFLAQKFFQTNSEIESLILMYAIMPVGLFSRPLGALFFGMIGDSKGYKTALFISLFGMSLVTFLIGCIPEYNKIGSWGAILMTLARFLQNFFNIGETTGASLLVLNSFSLKKSNFLSGIFSCSSVLGILIASSLITIFAHFQIIDYWRILYFFGGTAGFLSLFLRSYWYSSKKEKKKEKISIFIVIKSFYKELLGIIIVFGFFCSVYHITTSMMNSFLPLVTKVSKEDAVKSNTFLLLVELFSFPLFGYLCLKFRKEKVMFFFSMICSIMSIPLFSIIQKCSYLQINCIRIFFVILASGFFSSVYAWAKQIAPKNASYTLISLGSALGSQLVGGGGPLIGLILYNKTKWVGAPAVYICLLGMLSCFLFFKQLKSLSKR